jgi:hypothetical protein
MGLGSGHLPAGGPYYGVPQATLAPTAHAAPPVAHASPYDLPRAPLPLGAVGGGGLPAPGGLGSATHVAPAAPVAGPFGLVGPPVATIAAAVPVGPPAVDPLLAALQAEYTKRTQLEARVQAMEALMQAKRGSPGEVGMGGGL